ncbi:MAG: phosphoribosylformylglycinamidine synthase subunit PurL [Candidatus Levyibacteriota bacterium]
MIQTVRVSPLLKTDDVKGLAIEKELKKGPVATSRVYYLEGITAKEAKLLAEKVFAEKLTHSFSINVPLQKNGSATVEVAYKPGVMNPEVASIKKVAADLGIKLLAADSATEYHFLKTKKEELPNLVERLKLYNPTVEWVREQKPSTLLIKGVVGKTQIVPIHKMDEKELLELSKDKLFLNLEEMQLIQNYFKKIKRDPTDCELETLAQTWSEHCAHKTFKANLIVDGKKKTPLIKRLQKEALKHKKHIVSAFVDNSGVMRFYNGYSICGKVETHNSPSAIEPYGGAATGSGGVFRDVLGTGLGAKTIASTDIFCFAYPNLPVKDLPAGCLPPDYLFKRVITGVKDYGNRMGIPTNNGSVHFHNDFRAKPTVIVGAYGLIPTGMAKKGKAKKGDSVVAVGGKTGRDGIHGATFSSAEMTDKTVQVNSSAVQIGNAIEEKRMFDAILEARDQHLLSATQDCGAGGFSSAIGEMGEELGVTVDLSLAPLKYQGLSPWEIWVSESQERMVLAIPKKNLKRFLAICKKYNVEPSVLGTFDGKKRLQVFYGKEKVCDLDMGFLHHGLPQRTMRATQTQVKISKRNSAKKPLSESLKMVLSDGNIASKEPILRLYDHTVQGTNALQPFSGERLDGPSDAVILRPLLKKKYGMVLSHGLNPILNNIDPYKGSLWASVEALSNYVAVGGNYKEASLINNYIWPFPDEESLWSLDRCVDAVVDVMKTFRIPVISGKDSLSSTYRGKDGKVIKIPPVLCMSVFGRILDVSKTVSADFKQKNASVYLVGNLDTSSMGGTVLNQTQNNIGGEVPNLNLKKIGKVFEAIYKGIQKGKIISCHDVSEGGVVTAFFEMCVGGGMGGIITIPKKEKAENFLFTETAGCFLVELSENTDAKKVFKGLPFIKLGKTKEEEKLEVTQNGKTILEKKMAVLTEIWKRPMQKMFA